MVGTRYTDITDTTRDEVLGRGHGKRRIAIRFYFPAVDSEEKLRCAYLTPGKSRGITKKTDLSPLRNRAEFYENVELREGTFPLILFSHGYGMFMEQNSALCCYLAERGYLVASIGHSHEGCETIYTDGTASKFDYRADLKILRLFTPKFKEQRRLMEQELSPEEALARFDAIQKKYDAFLIGRVEQWAMDDRCALREIRRLSERPGSFLYQRIDWSNGVGATGHSFGGDTAYYHCVFDDEISCGVNMDGALYGDYGEAVNHKPYLQLTRKATRNVTARAALYHDRPVHCLEFRDMEHIGFTDLKLVIDDPRQMGTADPELVMDTINEAHAAFFDCYLKRSDTDNAEKLPIREAALERYELL